MDYFSYQQYNRMLLCNIMPLCEMDKKLYGYFIFKVLLILLTQLILSLYEVLEHKGVVNKNMYSKSLI